MVDASLENDKAQQILTHRAELIAREKRESSTTSDAAILVFHIGKTQKYAIPYSAIHKVVQEQKLTMVPGVNPVCSAILYHNAEIWPVINLSVLLNCQEVDTPTHFILLQDAPYHYAFSVGTIIGQVSYDESVVLERLSRGDVSKPTHVLGIYQTDIVILDINAIFKVLKSIRLV